MFPIIIITITAEWRPPWTHGTESDMSFMVRIAIPAMKMGGGGGGGKAEH